MVILRAACLYAADVGYVGTTVRKWGVPTAVPKLRYLSAEEVQRVLHRLNPETPVKAGSKGKLVVPGGLLREARQDTYDLFLALVLLGGRWNEVAKLTWRQVDVAKKVVRLFGFKGDKERSVPLVGEVATMIARRARTPRGALVFPGDGGKARSGPCRALGKAMDAEGLNNPESVEQFGRATIHSLRHTYASWLRQNGLGLDEIQPLLGHADIKTTMIYAKVVSADTLDKASTALGLARPEGPLAD